MCLREQSVQRVLTAILGTSATKAFTMAVNMLLLVISARWIGAEGRGILAASITWMTLAGTVSALSIGHVMVHRAAEIKTGWLPLLLGSSIVLAAIMSTFGWLAFGALSLASPDMFGALRGKALAITMAGLPFVILEQYFSYLLMARGEVFVYNRTQAVARSLLLVSVCLMAWSMDGALLAILAAFVICQAAIVGTMGLYLIRKASSKLHVQRQELLHLARRGVTLHPNAIGGILIGSIDVILLNMFAGPAETGQYQFALQFATALLIAPQAAQMVLFGLVARSGPDESWGHYRRVVMYVLAAVLAMIAAAHLLYEPAVAFLIGPEFSSSSHLFETLVFGLPGMALTVVMAPQWIGRGLFWQASLITVLIGAGNALLNYHLIPSRGADGAVVAFVIVNGIGLLGNGLMFLFCETRWRRLSRSTGSAR